MKLIFFLFFTCFFLLLSCKDDTYVKPIYGTIKKESSKNDSVSNNVKPEFPTVVTNPGLKEFNEADCIFDQAKQTDDFLKGIKELEGYSWNQEDKTAEIVLNDHWYLSIHRGGCDHFSIVVNFIYDKYIDFEENQDMIFNKIIWISNLLDDLDGDIIKKAIDDSKVDIQVEDNKRHIYFMDGRIYESYYMNFYTTEIEASYIRLSYHLN